MNFPNKESITSYKIIIENPIDYVITEAREKKTGKWITKKTKKYFTANIWYGSTGSKFEGRTRGQIKKKAMWFLHSYINKCPKFDKFPLRITYTYCAPITRFDLQNKLFFWAKLFEDYLVSRKLIPDDNVKYIQSERYEFAESSQKKLIILIESI